MKNLIFTVTLFYSLSGFAQAVVMNPGKAIGQLVILSAQDMLSENAKYKSLNPLSIPVFAELPMNLSVVSGVITLQQQNLLSHVQIKSSARKTPNLDISKLEGGINNPIFNGVQDGSYIEMELIAPDTIKISPSTEEAALAFYNSNAKQKVELKYDLSIDRILTMDEMDWTYADKVGSKAANYAELAKALNSPERTVVRYSYALPFSFYNQFVEINPTVKAMIQKVTRDPLMKRVAATEYRTAKLNELNALIMSPQTIVDSVLIENMLALFDTIIDKNGKKRNMKLRSATNSEDLPNFNGAGLYTSAAYKATKKKKDLSKEEKVANLTEALKIVWGSIWNLRAFEERNYFSIPHQDVYMGIQINPSFGDELADGVVVTKNIANVPILAGDGVYIEAQRGDLHSVANPNPGIKPQKILVLYDKQDPLNQDKYTVNVLQQSNIANDMETILAQDNPTAVMSDEEAKDLSYQCLKAVEHFRPLLGNKTDTSDFSLDIEFKVDAEDTDARQVYLKQARPYLN